MPRAVAHAKIHKIRGDHKEHVGHLHGGFLSALLSMLPVIGPVVGNLLSGILGNKHGEGIYEITHRGKKKKIKGKGMGHDELAELMLHCVHSDHNIDHKDGFIETSSAEDSSTDEEGAGMWGSGKKKTVRKKKGSGKKKSKVLEFH